MVWCRGARARMNASADGMSAPGGHALFAFVAMSHPRSQMSMSKTIVEQLADFTTQTRFDRLPPAAVNECKRAMLDSIGVAMAEIYHPKGRAGIEYGRIIGGGNDQATIMGTGDRVSLFGAAFANAELINALDMCSTTLPGHVT